MKVEKQASDNVVPTDGSPGTSDVSWLTIVEHQRCAGCGFEASAIPREKLTEELKADAASWLRFLEGTTLQARRNHRVAEVWSPLEYGVHVRDVLDVFTTRVQLMLDENEPDLGWWDHEEAIRDGSANRSDPNEVGQSVVANADRLVSLVDFSATGEALDSWNRRGARRGTEVFTVESKVRFALHELVHHLVDARAEV